MIISGSRILCRQRQRQNHIVDTYRLVQQLERDGNFSRRQSIALMRLINEVWTEENRQLSSKMVTKSQVEKETYFYKAALHDMKSELTSLRKTETANLQSATMSIERDLESLSSKFREDSSAIKSEMQLDLNQRRSEMKDVLNKQEMKVQEMDHYMSIRVGELKTAIETTKLELLTKWASSIALMTAAISVITIKFS